MENLTVLQHALEMGLSQFHSYANYTVTSIYQPYKVTMLRARHENKPSTKSQLAAFYGTAMHDRLEKMLRLANAKYGRYMLERTLTIEHMDRIISGKYDVYDTEANALIDLKTANTWKIIFDPEMEDWTKQQNIYRWLMKLVTNQDIDKLQVMAWYKDWKQGEALRNKSYPQNQVVMYDLPVWDFTKTREYVEERLRMLINFENMTDDDIPECTREERWERHPGGETVKYALLKNDKAKRAARVLPTMEEMVKYCKDNPKKWGSDSFIEVRYAEPKRCIDYCGVNHACNWYKSFVARTNAGDALTQFIPIKEVV